MGDIGEERPWENLFFIVGQIFLMDFILAKGFRGGGIWRRLSDSRSGPWTFASAREELTLCRLSGLDSNNAALLCGLTKVSADVLVVKFEADWPIETEASTSSPILLAWL
jgi:hypothetical protein